MSKKTTIVSGILMEPQMKETRGGKSYMEITVPVTIETGRQDNQPITETYYYRAVFWDEKAQEYLQKGLFYKGRSITLMGTVKTSTWLKADGSSIGTAYDFTRGFSFDLGARDGEGKGGGTYQDGQQQYQPPPQQQRQGNQPYRNQGGNQGGYQNNQGNQAGNRGNNNYQQNRGGNQGGQGGNYKKPQNQGAPQQGGGNPYQSHNPEFNQNYGGNPYNNEPVEE